MSGEVTIRPQRISDAKRFFEIVSSPNFRYIPIAIKSVEEEKKFLRLNREKRRRHIEYNFSILYDGTIVGAIGVKLISGFPYVGEIGYLVDEGYWGRGIAPRAVRLIEAFAFEKLRLLRLEILIATPNTRSVTVAVKCGYTMEGRLRRRLFAKGVFYDAYLYAKVRE
jgi:ribosomal-protein-alanine N-acetyltransferase